MRFLIAREGSREALSFSTVECIILLTLWFIILSLWDTVTHDPLTIYCLTDLSFLLLRNAILLHISEVPRSVRLALTLHAYRARAQLNRALAHLFQPSQGQLNELRSHQSNEPGFGGQTGLCTVQVHPYSICFNACQSTVWKTTWYRHVHNSLRSKSKSSLKSLRSSLSQVPSLYLCDLSATRVQVADSSFHLWHDNTYIR